MATASVASLIEALRRHQLLQPVQLEEVTGKLHACFPEPKDLARELILRGWLTPYQANHLLQGHDQELVLGTYILLERLGEGATGQVFKARHRKLRRIAAVKVIRKERLANPDAVRRFEREVRAAAALAHPNIALAFDADQVAGTNLLVMEYVEGSDLAKLVKKDGPFPIPQACDAIRQAALGLQHAFERGLVHRDIKPQNILKTTTGIVKVLDMGLARHDQPGADPEEDDTESVMTQEGMVMGTPDYMAPEQALGSRLADTRSDIYSLGCTLYFLLTGKVPFPSGSPLQKLVKHQYEEPAAVESLRQDVPPEVAAVVRTMMAKKPEDRYQTPAAAAAALAEILGLGSGTSLGTTGPGSGTSLARGGSGSGVALGGPGSGSGTSLSGRSSGRLAAGPPPEPAGDTVTPFAFAGTSDTAEGGSSLRLQRPRSGDRRWLWAGVLGAPFVLGSAVLLWFLVFRDPGEIKPAPVTHPPEVVHPPTRKKATPVNDAWLKEVGELPPDKQVVAVADKLKELNPSFHGKVEPRLEDGVVIGLTFSTDNIEDISPLRVLPELKYLTCKGSAIRRGKLFDLRPLEGMALTALDCSNTLVDDLAPAKSPTLKILDCSGTEVADLAPLKGLALVSLDCSNTNVATLGPLQGMKLTTLNCSGTRVTNLGGLQKMPLTALVCAAVKVSDLGPLKGMPLTALDINGTQVADVRPLEGMKLTTLDLQSTLVADLTPLQGMKLTTLNLRDTPVLNLAPLQGMPLRELKYDFSPYRDPGFLATSKTLVKINDQVPGEFWKVLKARGTALEAWNKEVVLLPAKEQVLAVADKLKELNPGFDGKVTRKIVKNVVTELTFLSTQVADLSPVRALVGLKTLRCNGSGKCKLYDLAPLQGMALTALYCHHTRVADLTPLRGMPLLILDCGNTFVADLTPLQNMPLEKLYCGYTRVTDLTPLKNLKLTTLTCTYNPARDAALLRSLPTLKTINGKPAAVILK